MRITCHIPPGEPVRTGTVRALYVRNLPVPYMNERHQLCYWPIGHEPVPFAVPQRVVEKFRATPGLEVTLDA